MFRRLLPVALLAAGVFTPPALAANPAPGAPGAKATWAPADKYGFGTARQTRSTVWFTLRNASLSEVYYPDLDTPSLRGLQFAVTDGRTFVDRETVDDDPDHIEPVAPGVRARVEPVPGSLTFRQVTETKRWRLTKTWITDPGRATVLADVNFESLTGRPLQLYVLADAGASDTGNDDRGRGMVAWDADSASAVLADPPLRNESAGYRGTASDPWVDLQDHRLSGFVAGQPGNVVQGARTGLNGLHGQRRMALAIGFGARPDDAVATARASLRDRFGAVAKDYGSAWSSYLSSLRRPPASVGRDVRLYQQSLMVLAASEDKLNRGASVAAPNMPWVWGTLTLENPADGHSGPYHLVWPRDFYHVVTAQKAAGDNAAATRQLEYLWRMQKPDGSWWQNTEPDGTPHWTNLQMDEVALPVVLAWWLGRTGAGDWSHIKRAADFILANGPRTGQERWENQDGFSPNTIATEIAGLVCAAAVARANGDAASSARYLAKADEWQRDVEAMTATTNGPLSEEPYYLRVTKDGNPNAGTTYNLGDNHPAPVDQRDDRRQLVPRPRAVRRQALGRPRDPELAARRRPGVAGRHGQRPGLAPLQLRRLRRDHPGPLRLEHLRDGGRSDEGARVATVDRRARRVRVAGRPPRGLPPRDDRPHRQLRADAAGAGLGGHRGRHALGDAAGVDARAVHPARVVDPGGQADRAPDDRGRAVCALTMRRGPHGSDWGDRQA